MRIRVNRAPVLTLWGAVVAEELGFERAAALTLGKAVAGLNAVSKGRRLGVLHEKPDEEKPARKPARTVELLGRRIPVVRTKDGTRARAGDRPENPATVERYLERKLGAALPAVRDAMRTLARSLGKQGLEERAYELYEKFRPSVPAGEKGWGAAGVLDTAKIEKLALGGAPWP